MISPFKPFANKSINIRVMGKNLENEDWREEAPTLSGIPVKAVFAVPDNYFKQLSASIEAKIAVDKLKSTIADQPFAVPDGYFDRLQEDILAKTKAPAKILQLWRSSVLKYASAACFVLVAGLGVYFNLEQPQQALSNAEIANEQMLFDIDEETIIEHLQNSTVATPPISSDQSDLENYILNNFSTTELTSEY